jgi:histidinol-phosphate aminotransferase
VSYPFAERYEGDGLILNSNINPFGPSPLVIEEIKKIADKVNFYPPKQDKLKEKVSQNLKEYGFDISPKEIVFGNGSDEAIEFVFKFLMRRHKRKLKIIIGEGTFAFYEYLAKSFGLEVKKVKLNDFGYDLESIEKVAKKSKPCLICICNPINPTGKIIPKENLEDFLETLNRDGIYILSDEAYFEYANFLNLKDWRKDKYRSVLNLKRSENIFVTRTFSKVYGLAGIRIGYLITQFADIIESEIKPPFSVNYIALVCAEKALEDKEHIKKTLENNLEGMRILEKLFGELGTPYVGSWANFIFVQVKKKSIIDELKSNKIFVRDMKPYGFDGAIRVSIGKKEDMEVFSELFRKFFLKNKNA